MVNNSMDSRTETLRISAAILCLLLATSTFFPLCDARSHGRGLQGLKIRRTSINKPRKKLKSHSHLGIYAPLLGSSTFDAYNGSPSSQPLPPYNSLAPQPTPSSSASPYPPLTPPSTPAGTGSYGTPSLPAYSPTPNPPHYVPVPPSSTLSPPKHAPNPPKSVPSPPHVYLPPVVYPPPPSSPPSHKKPQYAVWCVAKPTVPDPIVQEAMDYACGSGADCKSIQPNGPCYQPNTLFAHASFAFNSYWQNTKIGGGTCDFGGTAMLVTADPSFGKCHYMLT